MTSAFVPFSVAAILSLALVPLCRALARRLGYLARPSTDRWHEAAVPLFGGIGIALSVFVGLLLFRDLRGQLVLTGSAAVMFVVGLVDDVKNLKPSTKLIAELVVASAFLFFGYSLNWLASPTGDSLLTILWVVGITNAFNLLDNMDGLCAGIALIAGVALFTFAMTHPDAGGAVDARYLGLLLGSVAGFLVYNVHPASVFMGDAGSLFLGTSFAGLTLGSSAMAAERTSVLSIVAAPVFILLIPILDTTLVTISRLLSGRSAATGGPDHLSHRLVAIGLSERRAVGVLWGLAAIAGAVGWAARVLEGSWSLLLVATCLVAMAVFIVYLAQVRVYDDAVVAPRSGRRAITPLIITLAYKRRVAEVLLDFCVIAISYYAAYRLRFEGGEFASNFEYFLRSLPIVLASQLTALFVVGAYRPIWRHFSLMDGVVFGKATLVGTIAAQLIILYLYRFVSYSRTVFVIHGGLLFVALVVTRVSFRLFGEFVARRRDGAARIVIYGAGDSGNAVLRELLRPSAVRARVLGFVDDDPHKHRARVHGYPVLGDRAHLTALVRTRQVDQVIVSSDSIAGQTVDDLLQVCTACNVTLSQFRLRLDTLGPADPSAPAREAARVRPFREARPPRHSSGPGLSGPAGGRGTATSEARASGGSGPILERVTHGVRDFGLQYLIHGPWNEWRNPRLPVTQWLRSGLAAWHERFYAERKARLDWPEDCLLFVFDLGSAPITFDFATFLAGAEIERRLRNLEGIFVVFVPGRHRGLRRELPEYEAAVGPTLRHWRVRHVLIPMLTLLPSVRGHMICPSRAMTEAMLPVDRSRIYPSDFRTWLPRQPSKRVVHDYAAAGVPVWPMLRATERGRQFIGDFLGGVCHRRRPLVITLRHSAAAVGRNSRVDEWREFAGGLDRELFVPIFVHDSEATSGSVTVNDEISCDAARWNLEIRMALYEAAWLNLSVMHGPMELCWYNERARYLLFLEVGADASNSERSIAEGGQPIGRDLAFATPFQHIVWQADTAANIRRAFDKMTGLLEAQTVEDPPRRALN